MQFYENDFSRVKDLKVFALDCETDSKDPKVAKLDCIVIANSEMAVRFAHDQITPQVATLLKSADLIYYQNFKYDVQVLLRHGIDLLGVARRDTMLLHHLIDETAEHSLDAMVKRYFHDNYKQVFWDNYDNFTDANYTDALEYVCKDGIYTYRLAVDFLSELSGRRELVDHVHRLAHALFLTELRGVRVYTALMQTTKIDMHKQIIGCIDKMARENQDYCELFELQMWLKELEKRKTERGRQGVKRPTFNFGSDRQIQWLLYDAMKLPVITRTKSKAPSTDYDTLVKLKEEHGAPLDSLIAYKELKTVYSTFVEGLLEKVQEGRVYPRFNENGTVTGRISHQNPNMGNMPKEGPIRNFFLPEEGELIGGADYSQLEVVVEANLTGDLNLAKIVLDGASKHDITAQGLGIGREEAKTLNFALQYWCGVPKVAQLMKVSYRSAQEIYNKYWQIYAGPKALKEQTDSEVVSQGFVTNLVGRVRHFPGPFKNEFELARAQRQAYNFKVQGPGGDFTNEAFYLTSEHLERTRRGKALWTVHDELVVSLNPQYVDEELSTLTQTMDSIGKKYNFRIPLKAKPYGPFPRWQKA